MKEEIMGFLTMLAGTILLILLGIIYFAITLLIVKVSAEFIFGTGTIDADWAVLAAAMVTLGSMIGGSMGRGTKIFMKG